MRNKPLIVAVALVALLSVLAFTAGWMFGGLKRPAPVQASAATSTPVDARAIFIPGGSEIDALRRGVPVDQEGHPPPMARVQNTDIRRVRNYPMQPPTIPHTIDGYQVDKNFNKCMDCHSRTKAEVSQAVPVSVTHYMDRDGHMLGQVSTRRYFCMQCHVSQDAVRPLVNNTFQDVDALIMKSMQSSPGAAAAKKH